jgi:hypothetical protein
VRGWHSTFFRTTLALALACGFSLHAPAQGTGVRSRIVQPVDESDLTALKGSTHPLARPEYDEGPVSPDLVGRRMLLLLQRSPEQETALQQLLAQQQDSSSPNFHRWLTPEQFGEQFGPSDQDIQIIKYWLSSHGLQVTSVSAGRSFIEFSGTADQVQQTFHTSIHNLNVRGEAHIANMTDARIPSALTPVVQLVLGLHNFSPKPASRLVGTYLHSRETGKITPDLTGTGNSGNPLYVIGPADFATIYDVFPLWRGNSPLTSTIDGTGVTIAIVGVSDINLSDVMSFRTLFGLPTNLPANTPQTILNGPDPGIVKGDESEADLDVEWSGAVAKNSQIVLVVSEGALSVNSFGTSGQDLSALYIVDKNIAPVMSESFHACEAQNPTASGFYTALWAQAASQGITAVVSAGDAGPADCDNFDNESEATTGISVNAIAATPYNVAVGGTDFNDVGNERTFFPNSNITTNDGFKLLSAVGYVPEIPWNDSCAQSGIANCTANSGRLLNILAGGGGFSAYTAKPAWQNGFGSPEIQTDGKRDVPDVSLFSSDGGTRTDPSFYAVCEADIVSNPAQSCVSSGPFLFAGAGGTSASAPSFAGMMAMVNQATGVRQGIANAVLYPLSTMGSNTCDSTSQPGVPSPGCIFYHTRLDNNAVPCEGGTPNCSAGSSTPVGVIVDPQNTSNPAWLAGGPLTYDRATGLGTINAFNLVTNWGSVHFTGTQSSLTILGQSVSVPNPVVHGTLVGVTVGVTSGGGVPTGAISLLAGASAPPLDLVSEPLTNGAVGFGTNLLPGGTYTVTAQYTGDSTFARSTSNGVSITVTPESSVTTPTLFTFTSADLPVSSSGPVQYGSPYILRVGVTNNSGHICLNNSIPCPTGTVALTDSLNGGPAAPLNDFNGTNSSKLVNGLGFLEDQPIQLSVGNHSIVASYLGDSSFTPSVSAPLAIAVTRASTATDITGFPLIIASGVNTSLTAYIVTSSTGVSPTGTISFFEGSTLLGSAPVVAEPLDNGFASASATISTSLSGLHFLPRNPVQPRRFLVQPEFLISISLIALALLFARFVLRRRRSLIFSALLMFAIGVGFVGCGGGCWGGGGGVGGGGGGSRSVILTATYSGDSNYTTSTSSGTTITVN